MVMAIALGGDLRRSPVPPDAVVAADLAFLLNAEHVLERLAGIGHDRGAGLGRRHGEAAAIAQTLDPVVVIATAHPRERPPRHAKELAGFLRRQTPLPIATEWFFKTRTSQRIRAAAWLSPEHEANLADNSRATKGGQLTRHQHRIFLGLRHLAGSDNLSRVLYSARIVAVHASFQIPSVPIIRTFGRFHARKEPSTDHRLLHGGICDDRL
jgi:hypothetical protein